MIFYILNLVVYITTYAPKFTDGKNLNLDLNCLLYLLSSQQGYFSTLIEQHDRVSET